MSRIRGSDTIPEKRLRSTLWQRGMRYRVNYKTPAGRADLVFLRRKLAIFVDGCFWHGCPEHYTSPRSRRDFWGTKLRQNVERDRRQTLKLEDAGWMVLRFWEHEIWQDLDSVVRVVVAVLDRGEASSHLNWRVLEVECLDKETDLEARTLTELRTIQRDRVEQRVRSTRKW